MVGDRLAPRTTPRLFDGYPVGLSRTRPMAMPPGVVQETVSMQSKDSRLRVRRIDNVTQVEFIDRNILDEGNIQAIAEEIARLIESDPAPRLLICFQNVDHLSSAALGALITINNKVRDRGGQLRLSNIDPQIQEVFAITRLTKIFQIHETAEEAFRSFKPA